MLFNFWDFKKYIKVQSLLVSSDGHHEKLLQQLIAWATSSVRECLVINVHVLVS